jgi:hypothetical protein
VAMREVVAAAAHPQEFRLALQQSGLMTPA